MSGSCPLTPTHAALLQTEGAHATPREAHSLPENHALAHAHRARHHAHNHSHHKLTARQKTAIEQATLAATHAAAARDTARTLMPPPHTQPTIRSRAKRPRDPAHTPTFAACSPKLHELGEHAIFMLHTRRRMAQLHGPVPCKQSPRLHTACVPPATACKRKQQRAAAQRATRLSLFLSIYSPSPRTRHRALRPRAPRRGRRTAARKHVCASRHR